MTENSLNIAPSGYSFFLSEIIGRKVIYKNKKIGKLKDIIIFETETIPEVTFFIVSRPFGYQALLIPWKKVAEITNDEIIRDMEQSKNMKKIP